MRIDEGVVVSAFVVISSRRNSRAVCLVLIQYGADINQQDEDGDTPLMLAEGTELKQAMTSM